MIKVDLAYVVNLQNNTSQNDLETITYQVAHQDNPLQNDSIFFVPTTLQFNEGIERGERRYNGVRLKHFLLEQKLVFIGHQLQCFDEELTTITPRFFPKMKV